MDFVAVKVDGSDVKSGICEEVFMSRDSRFDVTSANFNSEKIHEDDIFVRQDILQFFSGESKDYRHLKFPQTLYAL